MLKFIDNILNKVTMYKLVLYCLSAWILIALLLSYMGQLGFAPQALLFSTAILLIVSWVTNALFVKVFETQANSESVYITALILALLISPPLAGQYLAIVLFLIWAGIWGMAAKFILAFGRKHIFNPAAVALVITSLAIGQSATWWIATIWMMPFILIGGLLITRKIHRFDLVISFAGTALAATIFMAFFRSSSFPNLLTLFRQILIDSPIIFFALVMLTEPLTTPPTRSRRIIYGVITGLLSIPNIHLAWLYFTPELALCLGNIASWAMSPKFKYVLTLKSKSKIARDTGEFIFSSDRPIHFKAGQYLEWTLAHKPVDIRGNRRYFTISSAPSEGVISLGIKFDAKKSSSFKKALAELEEGQTIMAGQLSGDFTLPRDKKTKLCFIAGGIGITPFRSMISYMLDSGDHRDVALLYSCRRFDELAYTNLIHHAHTEFGLKTISTLTDLEHIPADWAGYKGYISVEMILQEIPDYLERTYFISGPHSLVSACEKVLFELDIPKNQIKTDYFPGF